MGKPRAGSRIKVGGSAPPGREVGVGAAAAAGPEVGGGGDDICNIFSPGGGIYRAGRSRAPRSGACGRAQREPLRPSARKFSISDVAEAASGVDEEGGWVGAAGTEG